MKYLILFLLSLNVKAMTKVAIIDSGLNIALSSQNVVSKLCQTGHYDFSINAENIGSDFMSHGTLVANEFTKTAGNGDYCILIYKVFGTPDITSVRRAMVKAYRAGASYMNLSLSMNFFSRNDKKIFKAILDRGVKVFVAAGNSNDNLNRVCDVYPQCYVKHKNLYIVGARNFLGRRASYSNYGLRVNIYDMGMLSNGMIGTSFASPRAMGQYLKEALNDN